jgi:hypothetical protein
MTRTTRSRYHILVALALLPFAPPARFQLQEHDEYSLDVRGP